MRSKLEKKYKKLFKHRNVTNVEVDASTLGSQVRVYYRFKRNAKVIEDFVMKTAGKAELEYCLNRFADETKKYTYYLAVFQILK